MCSKHLKRLRLPLARLRNVGQNPRSNSTLIVAFGEAPALLLLFLVVGRGRGTRWNKPALAEIALISAWRGAVNSSSTPLLSHASKRSNSSRRVQETNFRIVLTIVHTLDLFPKARVCTKYPLRHRTDTAKQLWSLRVLGHGPNHYNVSDNAPTSVGTVRFTPTPCTGSAGGGGVGPDRGPSPPPLP